MANNCIKRFQNNTFPVILCESKYQRLKMNKNCEKLKKKKKESTDS